MTLVPLRGLWDHSLSGACVLGFPLGHCAADEEVAGAEGIFGSETEYQVCGQVPHGGTFESVFLVGLDGGSNLSQRRQNLGVAAALFFPLDPVSLVTGVGEKRHL